MLRRCFAFRQLHVERVSIRRYRLSMKSVNTFRQLSPQETSLEEVVSRMLLNVFRRQPTDAEFRVAPVLGEIFREFSRDLTSTTV